VKNELKFSSIIFLDSSYIILTGRRVGRRRVDRSPGTVAGLAIAGLGVAGGSTGRRVPSPGWPSPCWDRRVDLFRLYRPHIPVAQWPVLHLCLFAKRRSFGLDRLVNRPNSVLHLFVFSKRRSSE
jgi:hypothetical protein